jgi:hypothetical protein
MLTVAPKPTPVEQADFGHNLKPTPVAQVDANSHTQAHSGGTSRLRSQS